MSNTVRAAIVVALVAAVGVTFSIRSAASRRAADAGAAQSAAAGTSPVATTTAGGGAPATQEASAQKRLPRLVDLGADKCIPCQMMMPILAELGQEYEGRLVVDFIDVWKMPEAGEAYGVSTIPTQIFYDADGNELFRHIGFFAKEDILAKWKELGVDLAAAPAK